MTDVKQQAKELVAQYYSIISNLKYAYILEHWEHISKNTADNYFIDAKGCALICVSRVIASNPHSNPLNTEVYSTMQHWTDIKQAINEI